MRFHTLQSVQINNVNQLRRLSRGSLLGSDLLGLDRLEVVALAGFLLGNSGGLGRRLGERVGRMTVRREHRVRVAVALTFVLADPET